MGPCSSRRRLVAVRSLLYRRLGVVPMVCVPTPGLDHAPPPSIGAVQLVKPSGYPEVSVRGLVVEVVEVGPVGI